MGFMPSKILFIGNLLGLKNNHQMRKYFKKPAKEGPTAAKVPRRGGGAEYRGSSLKKNGHLAVANDVFRPSARGGDGLCIVQENLR
jgi:hypothetical protein